MRILGVCVGAAMCLDFNVGDGVGVCVGVGISVGVGTCVRSCVVVVRVFT